MHVYRKDLNLVSFIVWTSWKEIKNILEDKLDEFSSIERRFVDDDLNYLRKNSARAHLITDFLASYNRMLLSIVSS